AWILRNTPAASWLFAGTDLHTGSSFANAGIEIDSTTSTSPRNVQVVAEIPNLFGPGFTATMTYYETPRGAKVFAAGAFTLAGSAAQPQVATVLANLWNHLAQP